MKNKNVLRYQLIICFVLATSGIAAQTTETKSKVAENFAPYSAMLKKVLGQRLDSSAKTFTDMFAADGILEFPYNLTLQNVRLEGKAAIAAQLEKAAGTAIIDSITNVTVHQTTAPNMVILEFDGKGHNIKTGHTYKQHYISVITMSNGYIIRYVDFFNPLGYKGIYD